MKLKYMKFLNKGLFGMLFMITLMSCTKERHEIVINPKDYHKAVDLMTSIMVHDIFSPPVASRIYSYSNIAAYEVMCQNSDKFKTLAGQITDLKPIPLPDSKEPINFNLAALVAYFDVGKELIFSEDKVIIYRDSLYGVWKDQDEKTFELSKNYGLQVAQHIKDWIATDNYKETRTMPKFSVLSEDVSRWQPTPPDYMDGIEPHWSKIRPFVIDSAAQFKPMKHPKFSLDKGTDFYNELMEVYNISKRINKTEMNQKKSKLHNFGIVILMSLPIKDI